MSFFRYPGGKKKTAVKICSSFPLKWWSDGHFQEFREPFFGSGAVTLKMLSNRVSRTIDPVWINEYDVNLANLWNVALKKPSELLHLVDRWEPSVNDFFEFRREFLDGMKPTSPNDVDVAFKKLVMHCCSFSGLGVMSYGPVGGKTQVDSEGIEKAYQIDQPWSAKNIRRQIKTLSKIMSLHTLKFNECTNLDFEEVISTTSATEPVIYLDPPYVGAGKRLYEHSFNQDDHLRLANSLKSRSKWLLSYDDHPLVRDLYHGCQIQLVNLKHQIPGASDGTELLISP